RGGAAARGHSRRRAGVHPVRRRVRRDAGSAARRGRGGAGGDGGPRHGLAGRVARARRRPGVAAAPAGRARPRRRAAEPLQPGAGAAAGRRPHRRRLHAHLLGDRVRGGRRRAPAHPLAAPADRVDRRALHARAALARPRTGLRRAAAAAARDDRARLRRARRRAARHAAAARLNLGGPDLAPQTPQRSERPGTPVAPSIARRCTTELAGPRPGPHWYMIRARPLMSGLIVPPAVPVLALASELMSAASTVLISRGLRRYGPYTGAWINLAVGTACVWIAVLAGGVGRPTLAGVAYFALAGLIGTVGGRLLRFMSIETVGASISAALINLNPLVPSGLAILLLGG